MKKLLLLGLMALVAVLPFTSFAQCDYQKLAKAYALANFMPKWNKLADSAKYVQQDSKNGEIRVSYANRDTILRYEPTDGIIIDMKDNFLEIVILGKTKRSFFFVEGQEIRKLTKTIFARDNFRVCWDGTKFIFNFEDGYDYGVYDPKTKEFCKTKQT